MARPSDPEKYNWLQFATERGVPLQRKYGPDDSIHTQVKSFLQSQGQTLRTLYHVDDPLARLASQIMRETRETVGGLEQQLRSLQQYVDLNKPEALRNLDLSLQQDLLDQARRVNELQAHWQAITKLQGQQLGTKYPNQMHQSMNLDYAPELYKKLEQMVRLMNILSFHINPTFNPRP